MCGSFYSPFLPSPFPLPTSIIITSSPRFLSSSTLLSPFLCFPVPSVLSSPLLSPPHLSPVLLYSLHFLLLSLLTSLLSTSPSLLLSFPPPHLHSSSPYPLLHSSSPSLLLTFPPPLFLSFIPPFILSSFLYSIPPLLSFSPSFSFISSIEDGGCIDVERWTEEE